MTIAQGQTGPDVVTVQRTLVAVGFPVTVDGIYGPKTAAAVQQFQQIQGLPSTGVVDDTTWGAFQNVLGQRAYATSLVPAPAPAPRQTALVQRVYPVSAPIVTASAPGLVMTASEPGTVVTASSAGFPKWLTTPAMLTFLGVALVWVYIKWGRT